MNPSDNVLALETVNLCKHFGGLPVTQDVSIKVRSGERRLLLGPNGAGKTTLFNLITGDRLADSGQIKLFGEDISKLAMHKRAHRGMSRTYQIITLFPHDTLERNVALGLLALRRSRWDIFLPMPQDIRDEARRVLDLVGLEHLGDRPISVIAYGEKRRVEIAMALAQNPKLVLLDEPFAGLSIDERQDVRKLLIAIPREVTIIMIEHDMDVALDLADRITLLHFGEVIVEGTRAEVVADSRTREVYLGE